MNKTWSCLLAILKLVQDVHKSYRLSKFSHRNVAPRTCLRVCALIIFSGPQSGRKRKRQCWLTRFHTRPCVAYNIGPVTTLPLSSCCSLALLWTVQRPNLCNSGVNHVHITQGLISPYSLCFFLLPSLCKQLFILGFTYMDVRRSDNCERLWSDTCMFKNVM